MKPTLQFQFETLGAMHRFLEKIIPVVDDGTLTEATVATLKAGAAYQPQPDPVPAPVPEPQPVQTTLPYPLTAAAPAPVPAAPVTPVAPVQPMIQPVPMVTAPAAPVQPVQPVVETPAVSQPVAAPAPVPTAVKTYTRDELAVAAVQLVDTGRQAELGAILDKYGVKSLPELPEEQFPAFAADLRAAGLAI